MRNSNIELFRLILLFMVVVIHVFAGYVANIQEVSAETFLGTWLYCVSRPAVDCFVLISGYFGGSRKISPKEHIKKLGKPLTVYIPLVFLYVFWVNLSKGYAGALGYSFYNLVAVSDLFFHLWYVICFMLLVALMPYINLAISSINRKQYKELIIYSSLLYVLASSVDDFAGYDLLYGYTGKSFTEMGCFNFITFIIMYLIGGYIGRYPVSVRKSGLIFICLSVVTAVLTYWWSFTGGIKSFVKGVLGYGEVGGSYSFYEAFCKYNDVLVVLMAIFLFLFFKDLKINKVFINKLASSVYGGFLVHVVLMSLFMGGVGMATNCAPCLLFVLSLFIFLSSLFVALCLDRLFVRWIKR